MREILPYAYVVELVQVIVSVFGVLLLFWSVWDAVKDSTALSASKSNGTRMLIAMNNVRSEMAKFLVMIILLAAGIQSILLPPPTSFQEDDPKVQELIKMANEIDPRILAENREQRLSITFNRMGSILLTIILLIDSALARQFRFRFVRRVNFLGDRKELVGAEILRELPKGEDDLD
jgi:hypothetical protein